MKNLTPQSIKNIYHLFQAILANFVFGMPSKHIKIIGVTGTNGKTTTVQMITRILEEAGKKVATASTINFKLGEKEWVNATKLTTLSSFQVQKFISQAVKAGCEYLVLEISSHSLDQCRTWGIEFDTAVITNVTREHLDYHKTMKKYRQAKTKLFKRAKNAVINLDMEKPEEFLKYHNKNTALYSCHSELGSESRFRIKSGMTLLKAENIKLGLNESSYELNNELYAINLPGLFNIENALAATCVGMAYHISPEIIKLALKKIKGVPGRMERVTNNKDIEIIIDYAVTPDSLEKLYQLVSEIKQKKQCHSRENGNPVSDSGISKLDSRLRGNDKEAKIIAVFGACGERDRGKRPMMGEIVSKFADYIILTNEDPYGEDPNRIVNEVAKGIALCHPERSEAKSKDLRENNGIPRQARNDKCFIENINFWKIMDRREAIKKALGLAKPGDIFVITGKGAEETMAIGAQRIPWNDKKVILEELEKLN